VIPSWQIRRSFTGGRNCSKPVIGSIVGPLDATGLLVGLWRTGRSSRLAPA
jgi:hypothetical protein